MNKLYKIINEEIKAFINEMSFYSISYNNIITPDYIKNIEMSDEYERFIENYQYEENKTDIDKDEIEKTEDFKKWFIVELEYLYDTATEKLKNIVLPNNTIDIWRMLTVDENWITNLLKKGKHLGVYWAWDKNAAEAHWGKSNLKKVILKSNVKEEYINWIDTIKLNMDIYLGEDEKEIRLFKNTPILIKEILDENNNDLLDSPEYKQIKNKTFYA